MDQEENGRFTPLHPLAHVHHEEYVFTAYMTADNRLTTYPMSIEVRANDSAKACCRYDVLFLDEKGNATTVVFPDRFSRLIYIYTLL